MFNLWFRKKEVKPIEIIIESLKDKIGWGKCTRCYRYTQQNGVDSKLHPNICCRCAQALEIDYPKLYYKGINDD